MDVSLTFFIFHFFTRPEDFKLSKPKYLWNKIIQFHEKKIVLIISFHKFFGPCKPCYDVLKCAKNFLWLLVLWTFSSFFQNTLNALERDCNEIGAKVDTAIAIDNSARSHNMFAWAKGLSLFFTGILLPLTLVINFFASSISDKLIKDLLGAEGHSYLILFLVCTYIDL